MWFEKNNPRDIVTVYRYLQPDNFMFTFIYTSYVWIYIIANVIYGAAVKCDS